MKNSLNYLLVTITLIGLLVVVSSAEATGACSVGTINYPLPQDAIDDPTCSTIYIPQIVYHNMCLTIDRSLTLRGVGNVETTIRADKNCPVITVDDGTPNNIDVTIEALSVQRGTQGIYNVENLHLDDVLFYTNTDHGLLIPTSAGVTVANNVELISNISDAGGAAIRSMGDLTLENSIVWANWSNGASSGGGIASAGQLIIRNTIIAHNQGVDGGGLVHFGDSGLLENVMIRNNIAEVGSIENSSDVARGGGLSAQAPMTLINVTFAQNRADRGGAIHAPLYPVDLFNVTIAENTTNEPTSGAVHSGAYVSFLNTIVADNIGGQCSDGGVAGTLNSLGNNLESTNSCFFDQAGDLPMTDPLLQPLSGFVGPNQTYHLDANSPAIDAGTNTNCPTTDQRGIARPLDGPDADGIATCDIGAFEFDLAPTAIKLTSQSTIEVSSLFITLMYFLLIISLIMWRHLSSYPDNDEVAL